MKRTTILKQLCIAFIAVVSIASCKKEDDVNVTRALIDDWSLSKLSLDDGNGILDSTEITKAFDLGGHEIGIVSFMDLGKGNYSPMMYYYPSTFGSGEFSWSTDDKMQAITITNNKGESTTTQIIFQDFDHFAILEQNSYFYGQGVWSFYSRK